jgi:hypothetical protein
MTPPICPTHNVPMELVRVTQGDAFLGQFFYCPGYEVYGDPADECIGVIDADAAGNPVYEAPVQLELFSGVGEGRVVVQ